MKENASRTFPFKVFLFFFPSVFGFILFLSSPDFHIDPTMHETPQVPIYMTHYLSSRSLGLVHALVSVDEATDYAQECQDDTKWL